jgi:hypothetical protein
MAKQFSFGRGLLRAVVSLAFLSGLVTEALSSETATGVPPNKASVTPSRAVAAGPICQSDVPGLNASDSMLSRQLETGPPDEFGVAFEDDDPVEMFRVDIEQRTFGSDQEMIGPRVASKTARNIRPSISTPLLV